MPKRLVIVKGKKYWVNTPEYWDAGFLDSAGSGSILPTSPVYPPVVTLQPDSQTVSTGSNVVFYAGIGPYAPWVPPFQNMEFQWYFDGSSLTDGGKITGSKTQNLTITNVSSSNAGTYSLSGSNSWGSTTTNNAILLVV